jgi:hypothetical protein
MRHTVIRTNQLMHAPSMHDSNTSYFHPATHLHYSLSLITVRARKTGNSPVFLAWTDACIQTEDAGLCSHNQRRGHFSIDSKHASIPERLIYSTDQVYPISNKVQCATIVDHHSLCQGEGAHEQIAVILVATTGTFPRGNCIVHLCKPYTFNRNDAMKMASLR